VIRKAEIVLAAWLALAACAATAADRQFTLAVIPDTQNYLDFSDQRASGLSFDAAEIFYEQMAYIPELQRRRNCLRNPCRRRLAAPDGRHGSSAP
jgi:hypothetical protein